MSPKPKEETKSSNDSPKANQQTEQPKPQQTTLSQPTDGNQDRIKVSPYAKKLAAEQGVNLSVSGNRFFCVYKLRK